MNRLLMLAVGVAFLSSCQPSTEALLREKTEAYFAAWNRHDFTHPDHANFKRDTSYTWHGKKEGNGSRSIYNPNSGWKQWDIAWNGTYRYEITNIDVNNLSVTGNFHETTDFLKFIGMPEGFSAVVTFWFDEELKVKETQYEWLDSNRNMHEVIKPIVAWAQQNDSLRLQKVYPDGSFTPNTENAEEWKILFENYAKANEQ